MNQIQKMPFCIEKISEAFQVLQKSEQGYKYVIGQNDKISFPFRNIAHLGNECFTMSEQEQQVLYESFTKMKFEIPWLNSIPISKRELLSTQKPSAKLASSDGHCSKCNKRGDKYLLYMCSSCEKCFHLECQPKQYLVMIKNANDPYFDVLSSKQLDVRKPAVYDSNGILVSSDRLQNLFYCYDCYAEKLCCVCHSKGNLKQCDKCNQLFHKECGKLEFEKAQKQDVVVCSNCLLDGGVDSVDQLLSVKALSRETLFEYKQLQLKEIIQESDDENDFYMKHQLYKRSPHRLSPSNCVVFLVKFKMQSYWRCKWVSHSRLLCIAKSMMTSNNISNGQALYVFIMQNFGLDKAVDLKQVYSLSQEESSEEDNEQTDDVLITPEEVSVAQMQFPEKEQQILQLAQFSDVSNLEYDQMDDNDFLMQHFSEGQRQLIFQSFPQITQNQQQLLQQYLKQLIEAFVPLHYLIPEDIICRQNNAYLVKWTTQQYSQACYESIYVLLPFYAGRKALVRFNLIHTGTNRQCIYGFHKLLKRSWIQYENVQQNKFNTYFPLKASPPYLSVGNKRIFDFQLVGINWMLYTHSIGRGILFCDQMGLGKTIQVAGFIAALTETHIFGPHLIIVPNSTLSNWMREIKKWLPWVTISIIEVTDKVGLEISIRTAGKSVAQAQLDKGWIQNSINITQGQMNGQLSDDQASSKFKQFSQVISQLDGDQTVGSTPKFLREFNGTVMYDILLLSYETALCLSKRKNSTYNAIQNGLRFFTMTGSYWETLCSLYGPFTTMILDEGHRVKSESTQLYNLLKNVNAKQRIILTGTPIQNSFNELVTELQFVDQVFDKQMCNKLNILSQQASNLDVPKEQRQESLQFIVETIKPFVLIREQKDVFKNQIQKAEIYIPVDMTKIQKLIYAKLIIDQKSHFINSDKHAMRISNLAMSLRHITNHPVICEQRSLTMLNSHPLSFSLQLSSKLSVLDRLLGQILMDKRKVLVFSQFVLVLNVIEHLLRARQYPHLRLDGTYDHQQRQIIIDKFNDLEQNFSVLIMTTQTGGLGINLQAASDVIIYDSSWNPQNDIQAIHRVARIGQQKVVRVYRLFCRDSIDQKIMERAKQKLAMNYIFTRPLSNEEKDDDNVEEVLLFGVQDILQDFKRTIADHKIYLNSINLSSGDLQQLMRDLDEENVIQYSEQQIKEIINTDPMQTQQPENKKISAQSGAINRNEFMARFKVAQFDQSIRAISEARQLPLYRNQVRRLELPVQHDSIDTVDKWKNIFINVFGPDEQENDKVRKVLSRQVSIISEYSDPDSEEFEPSETSSYSYQSSESYQHQNKLVSKSQTQKETIQDGSSIACSSVSKNASNLQSNHILKLSVYYYTRFDLNATKYSFTKQAYTLIYSSATNRITELIQNPKLSQLATIIDCASDTFQLSAELIAQIRALTTLSFMYQPHSLVAFNCNLVTNYSQEIKQQKLYGYSWRSIELLQMYGEIIMLNSFDQIDHKELQFHHEFLENIQNRAMFKNKIDLLLQSLDRYVYKDVFRISEDGEIIVSETALNPSNCLKMSSIEAKDLVSKYQISLSEDFGFQKISPFCPHLISIVPPNLFQWEEHQILLLCLSDLLCFFSKTTVHLCKQNNDAEFALAIIQFRRIVGSLFDLDQNVIARQSGLDLQQINLQMRLKDGDFIIQAKKQTEDKQLNVQNIIDEASRQFFIILLKSLQHTSDSLPLLSYNDQLVIENFKNMYQNQHQKVTKILCFIVVCMQGYGFLSQSYIDEFKFLSSRYPLTLPDFDCIKSQLLQGTNLRNSQSNFQRQQYVGLTTNQSMKIGMMMQPSVSIDYHQLINSYLQREANNISSDVIARINKFVSNQEMLQLFCCFYSYVGFTTDVELISSIQTAQQLDIYSLLLGYVSSNTSIISEINQWFRYQLSLTDAVGHGLAILFADQVRYFIRSLIRHNIQNLPFIPEAAIQVSHGYGKQQHLFGIDVQPGQEALPQFSKFKFLASEGKRELVQLQFQATASRLIYKRDIDKIVPKNILQFMKKLLDSSQGINNEYMLLAGLIIIGLYKYGLGYFVTVGTLDQTLGLLPVLDILLKHTEVQENYRSDFGIDFTAKIQLPQQLFSSQLSNKNKINAFAVILFIFFAVADLGTCLKMDSNTKAEKNSNMGDSLSQMIMVEKIHLTDLLRTYGFVFM